ncbi:MAG: biosynthetic arginine decarboxylase [Simkaniaceae bacterium]|nr:biosynthetic arginine decarboxylase [Simkaniaceae bacterium]MCF7852214.1 biosynthetic arginine decarboxylase [Simkaniaceae bacterium]
METGSAQWDLNENKSLYWFDKWGEGYFGVNEKGNVEVSPNKDNTSIDLYHIVRTLVERGIEAPILIRFDGIIRNRINRISNAFEQAIEQYGYQKNYRLVYPIKVNQQKHVIDSIRDTRGNNQPGLEVGSKPELLAILAMPNTKDSIYLCNGYKDKEYIELALLSRKLGKRTIIIIEQIYECQMILEVAQGLGIEAEVGLRMKPSGQGSGKWASSGGDFAKFGLNTHELLAAIEEFTKAGKAHWLKLLHFHIGSQVTSILPFKKALLEAAHFYTELAKVCPSIEFFDIGGGLAVDYDGSKTANDSSMNYTVEEYARDVVYAIGNTCREKSIPEPTIISESGRALVAHHSVLITEVIDVSQYAAPVDSLGKPPTKNRVLKQLYDIYNSVIPSNCLEAMHDAHFIKQQILETFIQGGMTLQERAYGELIYRHLMTKIQELSDQNIHMSEDSHRLSETLVDTYFCNFSVFQSLPDSWAIQQLFPVMPIHRLDTKPTKKAKVADLSCDSDGVIDRFIYPKGSKPYLMLHEFNMKTPYYLGIFLVGAYQEALGGLHNLFGDTNAIHVDLHEDGTWRFKNLIEGDMVSEVLQYMQYDAQQLNDQLHDSIENALRQGSISNEEALNIKKKYKESLKNYTYLVI